MIQQFEIRGALRRFLAVLRMRLSFFDRTLRELVLDEHHGIRILPADESEGGLLDAAARRSGAVAPDDARPGPDKPDAA